MSDHPDVPRVMFDDDGESLNIEEAVEKFRGFLHKSRQRLNDGGCHTVGFTINVEMHPCDCDQSFTGRDEYCPLHGDKS